MRGRGRRKVAASMGNCARKLKKKEAAVAGKLVAVSLYRQQYNVFAYRKQYKKVLQVSERSIDKRGRGGGGDRPGGLAGLQMSEQAASHGTILDGAGRGDTDLAYSGAENGSGRCFRTCTGMRAMDPHYKVAPLR